MRAARRFAVALRDAGLVERTHGLRAELFGSLGLTGRGHGTDKAVLLGLEGETPEGVDVEAIEARLARIRAEQTLRIVGEREVRFVEKESLVFHRKEALPLHPNGMRFAALDERGVELLSRIYYSIGGGF